MQSITPAFSHILLVFLKEPIQGTVKTRLAKSIGSAEATRYYKAMVATLLHGVQLQATYHIRFCYAPSSATEHIKQWIDPLMKSDVSYDYQAQPLGDLGDRLEYATRHAFKEGFERVTLIGADAPSITSETLSSIGREVDMTIGPTYDGGYYLLSLQKFSPSLFQGIPWSSSLTCDATIQAAEKYGFTYKSLPKIYDIDELQDLDYVLTLTEVGTRLKSNYEALL